MMWFPRRVFLVGWCLGIVSGVCIDSAFALSPPVKTTQYAHEYWNRKDGLSDDGVFSLYHGSDGFLWVGTKLGLYRFDGNEFVRMDLENGAKKQFSFVRKIVGGENGEIWAGAIGGVLRVYHDRMQLFDETDGLEHPFVYAVAAADNGRLWVGSGGAGVWLLTESRFTLHPAYADGKLPSKVNDLLVHRGGTIWVATDQGIVLLNNTVHSIGTKEGLPSLGVQVLFEEDGGNVWAGTSAGLALLDADGKLVRVVDTSIAGQHVTAVMTDRDGQVWAGTDDGLLTRLRIRNNAIEVLDQKHQNNSIFTIMEDRFGAVWVGGDSLLERYREGQVYAYGELEGIPEDQILNVLPDKRGGVIVLDARGAVYRFRDGTVHSILPPGVVNGEGMLGMAVGEDGALYVGGKRLHRFANDSVEEFLNEVGDIVVLANGANKELIVGQTENDGVSTLSRFAFGRFEPLYLNRAIHHVQRILVDSKNQIWVSTGGDGVVRITPGQPERVFTTLDGLPHNITYALVEDASQRIWVATRSGLARIEGDTVKSLVSVRALTRSPVHLTRTPDDTVTVTTDEGIIQTTMAQLNAAVESKAYVLPYRRLSIKDGLRGREVSWRPNGVAGFSDGSVWMATNRGIAHVRKFRKSKGDIGPVRIDKMTVNGAPVSTEGIVKLGSGKKQLMLHFSAPAIDGSVEVHYQYRLLGYDDQWVDAGRRQKAYFTNVSHGHYSFVVRAFRSGSRNESHSRFETLRFKIEPAWWETEFSRASMVILVLLLLYAGHRIRVHQHRIRAENLEQTVTERTAELAELNEQLEQRVQQRTRELEDACEALDEEKERLSVTLRNLSEGVVAVDTDLTILLVNDFGLRLVGLKSQAVMEQPVEDVFRLYHRYTNAPLTLPVRTLLQIKKTETVTVHRAVLGTTAQTETLVDCAATAIFDAHENVIGAVMVVSDVTAKTRAEEKLQQTQKLEAVSLLAGGIAHDFNNMITGIVGYMDLAQRAIGVEHVASRWLSHSAEIAENAGNLTRQLLSFSSGNSPTTASHSLQTLVEQSCRFVLSGSAVSLELQVDEALRPCDVNAQQMRQVFDNLILNARQAMNEGGNLTIRMENCVVSADDRGDLSPGEYVAVHLSDTGGGIPLSVRDKIFDPFFTTKKSGTGLGLATVHSIVRKHGGDVAVQCVDGVGTTFTIRLRAADSEPVDERISWNPQRIPTGRGSILIVDDDESIRRITKVALENYGYRVATAADGDEMEEIYESEVALGNTIVLAIVDYIIPGNRGGAFLLSRLKFLDEGLPVLASSGYSEKEVTQTLQNVQFDGLLPKPYTVSMLLSAVSRHARK